MPATLLSVLVPLYNEEEFVAPLIERVLEAPLPEGMEREIIVVDDGSRDGSAEIVAELASRHPEVRLVRPSARPLSRRAAIMRSSRTPIWSTTRASMSTCCARCSKGRPTRFMARAS